MGKQTETEPTDVSSWEFGEILNAPSDICTVLRTAARSIVYHRAAWPIPEEAKALILAAPALLAACEGMVSRCSECSGSGIVMMTDDMECATCTSARAAIAAARPEAGTPPREEGE